MGHGPKIAISEEVLLLGEGKDEELLFCAMLKALGIAGVQVFGYGGIDNLDTFVRTLMITTGFKSVRVIGVTRDNDDNPEGASESLAGLRQSVELPNAVRLETFSLPSPGKSGALEDLVFSSVEKTPIGQCAQELLKCAEKWISKPITPQGKALIHAYLACANPGEPRMGLAASSGVFDFRDPAFQSLNQFLQGLVN